MEQHGLFLNYRQNRHTSPEPDAGMERVPHAQLVEAIADRLRMHFGTHAVFLDTGLRKGSHYPSELRRRLHESEVLVVVLHPGWIDDLNDREKRLGPGEYDWVHREISIALSRGIHLFPLLIGDADLPPRHRLPEDIRNMSFRQAQWIRFGTWEQDLRLLVQELENHVTAAPVPELRVPEAPNARPWWGFALTFLLGALLAVGAVWSLVDTPTGRSVWLTALVALAALMLALLAVALFVLYWLRGWLDTVDDAAARIAEDQKGAAIIGSTIAGVAIAYMFTGDSLDRVTRIVLMAVIVLIAVTFGTKWVLSFRTPKAWPKPELPVDTTSVRAELNLVGRHITAHEPLLTRLQRDQALFSLRQIEATTTALGRLAARGRREWLRAAAGWGWANALLLGFVLGATAGALIAGGEREWWMPVLALASGAVATASLWASVEFAFLRQRWHRSVVVAAVPERLVALREQLEAASIAPSNGGRAASSGEPVGGEGFSAVRGDRG
ncbi:toll/interleukin-1 receptor domain-containing protein [Actinosynnema pretiosum subsp. pretiosum]|uniref:Toll/interleukin-1 receptor domain-containing protein n=1 Tax=Actinosynnema pretiosum subsp. pretiosum TaxID=103721 RepID=A0AA45L5C8_9PSEU|nr:Serine/threonine protein kinase [Actinosynnema pretiosum subsp. pretiosum]QUF03864.1 toll/interleukin-1 receptor domain-containing protein [Actinosynnema pretiosum subsp. pretiosum]